MKKLDLTETHAALALLCRNIDKLSKAQIKDLLLDVATHLVVINNEDIEELRTNIANFLNKKERDLAHKTKH
jgi:uncharacterized protein YfdQ (DUF2303 family)